MSYMLAIIIYRPNVQQSFPLTREFLSYSQWWTTQSEDWIHLMT